jgi:hypothetical protein
VLLIEELLIDPRRRDYAAKPEADALTERDALQEAQLLNVRMDPVRASAWFLFDCRGALQIEMGNTAVIAAHGVRRLSWEAEQTGRLTAWTVVDSDPGVSDGMWSLSLAFVPDAQLDVQAASAEFFVGDVPGCDEAPPDYTEADDETIAAGFPQWRSTFEPVHAVFLDSGWPERALEQPRRLWRRGGRAEG